MHCTVTGGAGFIGSHLVDLLLSKGYTVKVLDDFSSGRRENLPTDHKLTVKRVDIRDFKKLEKHFRTTDIVFHLAAIPRVLYSVGHPQQTNDVNLKGTLNVILAAKKHGVKKMVFASSSSVMGNTKKYPTPPLEEYDAECPYAGQKAMSEMYMKMYSKLEGMDMTVVRFFNIYGPRADPTSEYSLVISKFIYKIKKGEKIEIYGDGKQARDFTYVTDAVNAMHMSRNLKGFNILNVGNEDPITINTLVKELKTHFPKVEAYHGPVRKGEIKKTKADASKTRKLLKWKPKVSFKAGLAKVIQQW